MVGIHVLQPEFYMATSVGTLTGITDGIRGSLLPSLKINLIHSGQ